VFELAVPQGAEVVGTYLSDWYAGTAAVTRNAFGRGHGWYVATDLDQRGVAWVVRQVLSRHGLTGRCPDVPELETAVRVAPDGTRLLFVLNHGAEPVEVPSPAGGEDLLTGERVAGGGRLRLDPYGVVVLREDA